MTNGNGNQPRWVTLISSPKFHSALLLFAGVGLTINESVHHGPERPSLYVLFAGMMGLPAFLLGRKNGDPK